MNKPVIVEEAHIVARKNLLLILNVLFSIAVVAAGVAADLTGWFL